MGRILALDIGGKRTGIAVTDPMQIIATALDVVDTNQLEVFLENYIHNEQVEKIVVGYPLNLNGTPTDATSIADKWIQKIKQKFPFLEVDTEDESYTSQIAVKTLVEAGYKKKDRRKKGNIDKISAVLILQNYLNKA